MKSLALVLVLSVIVMAFNVVPIDGQPPQPGPGGPPPNGGPPTCNTDEECKQKVPPQIQQHFGEMVCRGGGPPGAPQDGQKRCVPKNAPPPPPPGPPTCNTDEECQQKVPPQVQARFGEIVCKVGGGPPGAPQDGQKRCLPKNAPPPPPIPPQGVNPGGPMIPAYPGVQQPH